MALLVLEDVVAITVIPFSGIDAVPGYFYTNLIITDKNGMEFEITLNSQDKAVFAKLNNGGQ